MTFPKLFGTLHATVSCIDQEQERWRSPTRGRTLHIEFWRTMQPLRNFLEASVNLCFGATVILWSRFRAQANFMANQ